MARLISDSGRDGWRARLAGWADVEVAGGRFVSPDHDNARARQPQSRGLGRGQGMEALQKEAERTMRASVVRRTAVRFV